MSTDATGNAEPKVPTFVQRSVEQAADLRLGRIILTILAAPFYLLGLLLGAVVVVVVVAAGAVKLGIADVRSRVDASPADGAVS